MPPGPVQPAVAGTAAARAVRQPASSCPTTPGLSARWHVHDYPGPYCRWHHHPEYEIHLIQHGTGRLDRRRPHRTLRPGHLVLVGSNLPHHWISDLARRGAIVDRDVVFQFHPDWFAECQAPAARAGPGPDALLDRSARGIVFTGTTASVAAAELVALGVEHRAPTAPAHVRAAHGPRRRRPSRRRSSWPAPGPRGLDEPEPPTSSTRRSPTSSATSTATSRLAEAAATWSGCRSPAFSRYFQRASGQSFTDTVRKLRLSHACHLLEHTDLPIAAVCHRVGYRNLSNFNRQFKAAHDTTPRAYRRARQVG